jgi:hypothetical protein
MRKVFGDYQLRIYLFAAYWGLMMSICLFPLDSKGQVRTNIGVSNADSQVVSLISDEWLWERVQIVLRLGDTNNSTRVEELEAILFGESQFKRIRALSPMSPERVIQGSHAILRQSAALCAAKDTTGVFDQLLLRYYYGDMQKAEQLSESEQMFEVAKRLVAPTEAYLTAMAKEKNLTNTQHQVTVDITVLSKSQQHAVLHVSAHSGMFYRRHSTMEVKRKDFNGKWLWIPISDKPWILDSTWRTGG